jgi:hypothetical protein
MNQRGRRVSKQPASQSAVRAHLKHLSACQHRSRTLTEYLKPGRIYQGAPYSPEMLLVRSTGSAAKFRKTSCNKSQRGAKIRSPIVYPWSLTTISNSNSEWDKGNRTFSDVGQNSLTKRGWQSESYKEPLPRLAQKPLLFCSLRHPITAISTVA